MVTPVGQNSGFKVTITLPRYFIAPPANKIYFNPVVLFLFYLILLPENGITDTAHR